MSDETRIVEYTSEGGAAVKLSPGIVRQYLVNGNGNVSDQEVTMFLMLCRNQKLDPFQRDVHLIKYGNSPATMVVGKDTFTKRAERHPDFRGFEAGVLVHRDGEVVEQQGAFKLPTDDLVGGWARVYKENREVAYYASVSFEEYVGRTRDGEVNSQWKTKPATMIRKVALVQALREAFPESFSGLYDESEIASPVELTQAPMSPKDVSPKKGPTVNAKGKYEKPVQPDRAELEPIIKVLTEHLDAALEAGQIDQKEYDKNVAGIEQHIKAGDFETFSSSTIARFKKMEAERDREPAATEASPQKEDKQEGQGDLPIF